MPCSYYVLVNVTRSVNDTDADIPLEIDFCLFTNRLLVDKSISPITNKQVVSRQVHFTNHQQILKKPHKQIIRPRSGREELSDQGTVDGSSLFALTFTSLVCDII